MPLEIKVGHRYRTRSGDVVEIESKDWALAPWLFAGFIEGKHRSDLLRFSMFGRWALNNHPLDLIEELPAAEPLHPLWAQTIGQRDELGSVRVTCRMCDGAGCADSVTCENGTEVLPF